jgi:predicted acylesterase/phospholipase RssA
MERPIASENAWYIQPDAVDRWLCGVFEGGGAKGVAFTGALLGMRDLHCWFGAVAGPSAGAITAALVAAGLTPEAIDGETDRALGFVQTGVWKGVFRLKDDGGYYPSDKLTHWLDALLRQQVGRPGEPDPKSRVTFEELFNVTGIELNIVATDLSLRRQVVFSHIETPACSVADAVAASSAIPFAFPSHLLAVRDEKTATLAHHTVVDGGVWANFPIFVFEDAAFRTRHERTPVVINQDEIVGFLLDEGENRSVTRGEDVRFASQRGDVLVRAKEWLPTPPPVDSAPTPIGSRIAAALLWPFGMLGRLVEFNGAVEAGRWPRPRQPLVRHLVSALNGLFSGIHFPVIGFAALSAVALGSWTILKALGSEQLRVWPATDWSEAMAWFVRPVSTLVATVVALVVILTTFAATLGVLANYVLLRSTRRIIYGLASTYVAGPGAPEWATLRSNIVGLPIPPGVGALSFDLPVEVRRRLVKDAWKVTGTKVGALVGRALPVDSHVEKIL